MAAPMPFPTSYFKDLIVGLMVRHPEVPMNDGGNDKR